jgi:hypothetical protein
MAITLTPNIGLELPAYGDPQWNLPIIANTTIIPPWARCKRAAAGEGEAARLPAVGLNTSSRFRARIGLSMA